MEIMQWWNRFSGIPGGKHLFSALLGKMVPYTGSIGATVEELSAGRAEVVLKDRRAVRNHLSSVHAVALMNLGEVTSGLALVAGLPKEARAILTHFEIDFLKKARGTLRAKSTNDFKWVAGTSQELEVVAEIFNTKDECVARVRAKWKVGPQR